MFAKIFVIFNFSCYNVLNFGRFCMERTKCVLYDRDCIGCLECEMCDLDPDKVCDNCGKCLDIKDFVSIKIDKIISCDQPKGGKR